MRLSQAARSIFLTEFVSGFFLAMRYFFKAKVTQIDPEPAGRRPLAQTLNANRIANPPI